MLTASVRLLAIAAACLLFADLEITTSNPWREFGRMAAGALSPDLDALWRHRIAFLDTVVFALCGLFLGLVLGTPLSLLLHVRAVRVFCAVVRAVHEIFWAFLFLPVVGLNPTCGVLAIAIPYAGVFAKVFAEIAQEADRRPERALPAGADRLSRFAYGTLPAIFDGIRTYTGYRFECALRSSAVLGFIGLPTLGFHLETAFREGLYGEAAAILYAFYALIFSLRWWMRLRLAPFWLAAALVLLAKDVSLRWSNIGRFAYEILPWPMRRAGVRDGSMSVDWTAADTTGWFADLAVNRVLPGAWDTFLLAQVALAATGLLAVAAFPAVCRHFTGRWGRRMADLALIVLRTTPEYVLAYVFVQLFGPSMLPAILAISLHNAAILAYLTARHADAIELRVDAPSRRGDRFGYEVLPRVYGQLLAFLFYRWEIIARESAILGILGVYTLGFYVDSAIADDQLDRAVLLIAASAGLNVAIDAVSQVVRKRLRISVGEVVTV